MRVLVLGAGVVGTAAAYFLGEAGHDVTVVERQAGAGLETSFANGGIVSAYTARPWAHPVRGSAPTTASSCAHLVFSFSLRTTSSPSVASSKSGSMLGRSPSCKESLARRFS